MKLPRSSALIVVLSGSLILCSAGCEDSSARQRDEVQAKLTQIRTDLSKAMAAGGATAEEYQQKLTGIVSALNGLNGGEAGQQAAKALLAAATEREIAAVHANAAADLERKHAAELGVISAQVDAAIRLNSLAGGLASMDAAEQRTALQGQVQQAQQSAATLREHIATLEGPINERTTQNEQQGQEIERMRIEVGSLLQQARDKGYSAGLETYMRAMQLGREADKIELQVSQRSIDLDHELSPQHRMASSQLQQVEALTQALEAARTEIDAFATAAAGDAQASRTKAAELAKQIDESLGTIKSEADGALQAAYEEAIAALDRASGNAGKAASGGDAKAARMMSAGILEATARVHLAAARGLADRKTVLEKIKASGGAVQIAGVDGQLSEVSAASQEHVEKAREALTSAGESLEAVGGGASEVEAFRANLLTLNNALSGRPAASPTEPEGADAESPTGAPAAVEQGEGAESPETLVEAVKSVKGMADAGRMFDLMLVPSDPAGRQVLALLRSVMADTARLDAALQEKFGKSVNEVPGLGMGEDAAITDATLADVTETTGTLNIVSSNGKTESLPIAQVNGRWYIGDPNDPTGMSALGEGLGGESGAPASPEMQKMALQMMQGIIGAQRQAMQQLATRLENGEFTTFEEFQAAAQQSMQQAMGAGMGMPAGGAPPRRPASGAGDENK